MCSDFLSGQKMAKIFIFMKPEKNGCECVTIGIKLLSVRRFYFSKISNFNEKCVKNKIKRFRN